MNSMKTLALLALMAAFAPSAWAFDEGSQPSEEPVLEIAAEQESPLWDGSGTSSDPYLIKGLADWEALASGSAEQTYSGVYFRQTADISGASVMVGTGTKPFAGTYDGDGHTLGVNLNSDEAFTAPFRYICGATIRHLRVTGTVRGKLHTAGLVGACLIIDDLPTNTFNDCQVSATIIEKRNDAGMLRAGGFIGHGSVAKNVLTDCLFDGTMTVEYGNTNSYAAPFIGWSTYTTAHRQLISNCLEEGTYEGFYYEALYYAYGESDYRTDYPVTLERCYRTSNMLVAQGTFVFNKIDITAGCTYEFVSDPTVQFGGKPYWTSGATINVTVPDGTPFNHWSGAEYPGIFVSDCFKASGHHQLQDVIGPPGIFIQTTPIPEAETERTLWGVTYRYLSRQDYHFYFSDETVAAKGWHFENNDATDKKANLLVYDANGNASEITVITGYDESDYNDDGVQIHNDLVGDWPAQGKAFYSAMTTNLVPPLTGMLLVGEEPEATLTPTAETVAAVSTDLQGHLQAGSVANALVLNAIDNTPGFYALKSGATLAANRAYLEYTGASIRGLILTPAPTGIANVEEGNTTPSDHSYDLQGRRVATNTRAGIYILNGKKVLVK